MQCFGFARQRRMTPPADYDPVAMAQENIIDETINEQPTGPDTPVVIATFYQFAHFPDFADLRQPYKTFMQAHDIRGTILLAPEGINATVSGSQQDIEALLNFLRQDHRLSGMPHKVSSYGRHPFKRAKVRLKKETISLGVAATPDMANSQYADAQEWNRLLEDPDVTVIDTRNTYETHIGKFKNAIVFNIDNFKQLPEMVTQHFAPETHKKIAMYCTGGIRCEKFATYMRDQGFETVIQLKDGILKYLETIPEEENMWEGGCFVFDERIAVGHALAPQRNLSTCTHCGAALLPDDLLPPKNHTTASCPICHREFEE